MGLTDILKNISEIFGFLTIIVTTYFGSIAVFSKKKTNEIRKEKFGFYIGALAIVSFCIYQFLVVPKIEKSLKEKILIIDMTNAITFDDLRQKVGESYSLAQIEKAINVLVNEDKIEKKEKLTCMTESNDISQQKFTITIFQSKVK